MDYTVKDKLAELETYYRNRYEEEREKFNDRAFGGKWMEEYGIGDYTGAMRWSEKLQRTEVILKTLRREELTQEQIQAVDPEDVQHVVDETARDIKTRLIKGFEFGTLSDNNNEIVRDAMVRLLRELPTDEKVVQ